MTAEPHAFAAGMFAAAASLFAQEPARALQTVRAALDGLGILDYDEPPETLGRALLESLGAKEFGLMSSLWRRERLRLMGEGLPEAKAEKEAAAFVARELKTLEIEPREFREAVVQRHWQLLCILTGEACGYLDAICRKLDGAESAWVLEHALCALLRSIDPDNAALPPKD
jgi:hypothetical protein